MTIAVHRFESSSCDSLVAANCSKSTKCIAAIPDCRLFDRYYLQPSVLTAMIYRTFSAWIIKSVSPLSLKLLRAYFITNVAVSNRNGVTTNEPAITKV